MISTGHSIAHILLENHLTLKEMITKVLKQMRILVLLTNLLQQTLLITLKLL